MFTVTVVVASDIRCSESITFRSLDVADYVFYITQKKKSNGVMSGERAAKVGTITCWYKPQVLIQFLLPMFENIQLPFFVAQYHRQSS